MTGSSLSDSKHTRQINCDSAMIALLPLLLLAAPAHSHTVKHHGTGCLHVHLETEQENTFEYVADLFYPNRKYRSTYRNETVAAMHPHSRKSKKHRKQLTLHGKHKEYETNIKKADYICVYVSSPDGLWLGAKLTVGGETDGTDPNSKLELNGVVTVGYSYFAVELELSVKGPCTAEQASAPFATIWENMKKFGSDRLKEFKQKMGMNVASNDDKLATIYNKIQEKYDNKLQTLILAEAKGYIETFWGKIKTNYDNEVVKKADAKKDFGKKVAAGQEQVDQYLATKVFKPAFESAFPLTVNTFGQKLLSVFGDKVKKGNAFEHLLKRFIKGGYFSDTHYDLKSGDAAYQAKLWAAMFPDAWGTITECQFNSGDSTCYTDRLTQMGLAQLDITKPCGAASPDFCAGDWRIGKVAEMLAFNKLSEVLTAMEAYSIEPVVTKPLKWNEFAVGIKFVVSNSKASDFCAASHTAFTVDAAAQYGFNYDEGLKAWKYAGSVYQIHGNVHVELGVGGMDFDVAWQKTSKAGSKVALGIKLMCPYSFPAVGGAVAVGMPEGATIAKTVRSTATLVTTITTGITKLVNGIKDGVTTFVTHTKAKKSETTMKSLVQSLSGPVNEITDGLKTLKKVKKDGKEVAVNLFDGFKEFAGLDITSAAINYFLPKIGVGSTTTYSGAEIDLNYYWDSSKGAFTLAQVEFWTHSEVQTGVGGLDAVTGAGAGGMYVQQSGGQVLELFWCRDAKGAEFALGPCAAQKTKFAAELDA
eukprot:jgi/Bigna1/76042/fgenesh1_pg.38_\